jgi:hypothetical protein
MKSNIVTLCARKRHGKDTVAGILSKRHGFKQVAFADPIKQISFRLFSDDVDALWGESEKREKLLSNILQERGTELNDSYWLKVHQRIDRNASWLNSLFYDVTTKKQMCPDVIPSLLVFVRSFQKLGEGKDRYSKADLTIRHILQQLGTDWGRKLWPDVWCYHAFVTIRGIQEGRSYDQLHGLSETTVSDKTPVGFVISDCRFPDNETRYTVDNGGELWWIDASKRIREVFDPRKAHISEPDKQSFLDAGFDLVNIDNNQGISNLELEVKRAVRKLRR